MKPALCLTPDLSFFRPAVRAAASLIAQSDSDAFDIFIVCEAEDVAPGFDALDPALRSRINLFVTDFSRFEDGLAGRGRFSRAVFRRLFLDRVLPETYSRIVTMDSDMLVVRPGLSRLASVDLGGKPIAAAYDMIYLFDFNVGAALTRRFQASRLGLGLDLATPYFNAGLMVIDRAAWGAAELSHRVARALRAEPERYPFMEQDALNATLKGKFAPLSPRCNFMGEFLVLDLETTIEPIVLHFVNSPKPWQAGWRGEQRFAELYRSWFAASPWSDWALPAPEGRLAKPPKTAVRRAFAERLTAFLATQRFVDQ
ncbi:MAG TPA: glycosyltransferase [Roseiarcus sp.]|jgi:lipopolysaccharide biosynthesis glycosyltransferase